MYQKKSSKIVVAFKSKKGHFEHAPPGVQLSLFMQKR